LGKQGPFVGNQPEELGEAMDNNLQCIHFICVSVPQRQKMPLKHRATEKRNLNG